MVYLCVEHSTVLSFHPHADLLQTIRLVDESCPDGVALCIFAQQADAMPRAQLGDILELRNVVVRAAVAAGCALFCSGNRHRQQKRMSLRYTVHSRVGY
jgi:hypothetical protein